MGVGVAGLQAIATARRLGAVVTATDVRPATKEQVESLGAKFLAVEDEEFKNAQTAGGYAKEMSAGVPGQAGRAGLRAHREAGHRHHHRPDPRPPGAEAGQRRAGGLDEAGLGDGRPGGGAGRQCRGRQRRAITAVGGVKIVGVANLPGRIAADASGLYARNLVSLRRASSSTRTRRSRRTGRTRSSRPPWSPRAARSCIRG